MFPLFHRYVNLSILTHIGWDMGLRTSKNCVHACYYASMLACTYTDIMVMTGMSPRFHRYLYRLDPTKIGWVIKILDLWLMSWNCGHPGHVKILETNKKMLYVNVYHGFSLKRRWGFLNFQLEVVGILGMWKY